MDLTGIIMMVSIQRERYIVAADYVNLARDTDCLQLGICESNIEKEYC